MDHEEKDLRRTLDRLLDEKSSLSVSMNTTRERVQQEEEESNRLRNEQIQLDKSITGLRAKVEVEEQKLIQLSTEISQKEGILARNNLKGQTSRPIPSPPNAQTLCPSVSTIS
jgi:chromosome segregation ATPase